MNQCKYSCPFGPSLSFFEGGGGLLDKRKVLGGIKHCGGDSNVLGVLKSYSRGKM